jgi:hypothetical protein
MVGEGHGRTLYPPKRHHGLAVAKEYPMGHSLHRALATKAGTSPSTNGSWTYSLNSFVMSW